MISTVKCGSTNCANRSNFNLATILRRPDYRRQLNPCDWIPTLGFPVTNMLLSQHDIHNPFGVLDTIVPWVEKPNWIAVLNWQVFPIHLVSQKYFFSHCPFNRHCCMIAVSTAKNNDFRFWFDARILENIPQRNTCPFCIVHLFGTYWISYAFQCSLRSN